MNDKIPKVFISYSWNRTDDVLAIAERLVSDGIEVVIDRWNLHFGHSLTHFMEQSVADDTIDKVLIFSDSEYAKKANTRTGGVGNETEIISQKVYESTQQEKFIPIVLEYDDNKKPCLPHYLSSRLFIDFTKDGAYEDLVRTIYKYPLKRKPKLGSRPQWLDEPRGNYASLKLMIRQIENAKTPRLQENKSKELLAEYIQEAKKFFVYHVADSKVTFDAFNNMKDLRDVFLDYVIVLYGMDLDFSKIVIGNFEEIYNDFMSYHPDNGQNGSYERDYEILKLHIWELFICVIAFLRYYKDYGAIHKLVSHTYFLKNSYYERSLEARSYTDFYEWGSFIEDNYKSRTEYSNHFTLIGKLLYEKREKLPIFTGKALVDTDLFLCQIYKGLNLCNTKPWFAKSYPYVRGNLPEWEKLKSLEHCKEIMTLFGVKSLSALKIFLQKCTLEDGFRYPRSFGSIPSILDTIKLEEIGTLN